MILQWPQITMIVLTLVGLFNVVTKHGKPRSDTHNVWIMILVIGMLTVLMTYGGFFTGAYEWPQFVMLAYFALLFAYELDHNGQRQKDYNAYQSILISTAFQFTLFHGGFYTVV